MWESGAGSSGNNAFATAVLPAPIGPDRKMTLTPPVSHGCWTAFKKV